MNSRNPYTPPTITPKPSRVFDGKIPFAAFRIGWAYTALFSIISAVGVIAVSKDKTLYDFAWTASSVVELYLVLFLYHHLGSRLLLLTFVARALYDAFVWAFVIGLHSMWPPNGLFGVCSIFWALFLILLKPVGTWRRITLAVVSLASVLTVVTGAYVLFVAHPAIGWALSKEIVDLVASISISLWFATVSLRSLQGPPDGNGA